eukprot:639807-Hanusia_phi.AAC.1
MGRRPGLAARDPPGPLATGPAAAPSVCVGGSSRAIRSDKQPRTGVGGRVSDSDGAEPRPGGGR